VTTEERDRVLRSLKRHYPSMRNAEQIEAFGEVILDYDFAEVVAACKNHVATCRFFPHPSEVLVGLKPVERPAPAQTRGIQDRMLPYLNDENEHSVSRYAREHGLTWQEAKLQMEA